MGLPKKGSSKIQVADKSYRWAVSPHSGYMYIVIHLDAGKGQRLRVLVDYEPPVTPGVVRDYILEALREGWEPEKPGSPFGLDRSKPVSYPTRSISSSGKESPPVPPHKAHPVKNDGGYTCPVCSKPALSFVKDGCFSCGSCGRTFLPEDLRK